MRRRFIVDMRENLEASGRVQTEYGHQTELGYEGRRVR